MVPRRVSTPGVHSDEARHRGRISGQPYETPVGAEATDDGFVIGLPYGTTTDWVKHLLADGTATIVNVGGDLRGRPAGGEPPASENARFPTADQRNLRRFRIEQCVRVRRVDRSGSTQSGEDGPSK